MRVEITKGYDSKGKLVAYQEGATWGEQEKSELALASTFCSYRVLFERYGDGLSIRATTDEDAIIFAQAKFEGPYEIIRLPTEEWEVVHKEA